MLLTLKAKESREEAKRFGEELQKVKHELSNVTRDKQMQDKKLQQMSQKITKVSEAADWCVALMLSSLTNVLNQSLTCNKFKVFVNYIIILEIKVAKSVYCPYLVKYSKIYEVYH